MMLPPAQQQNGFQAIDGPSITHRQGDIKDYLMTDNSHSAPPANSNQPNQREGLLGNLLFNIIAPTLILTKLSGEAYLGPTWGIIVALAFPVVYGIRDFSRTGKLNFFSALGFISVLLTGGMSLLKLDPQYIAIKEAAIPGLFCLATLISLKTRYPLIKTLIYNDKVLHVHKVHDALASNGNEKAFDKALTTASYLVALSFLLSSVLNYALAKYLLVSQPGTEAYNAELGKMTALSFPVIAVPATLVMMAALFYLFYRIKQLTQLTIEDIIIT